MGLIERLFALVFGDGRNAVVETAQVFRENAEAGAERASAARAQALSQFGAEFEQRQRSRFDRVMDGVNRVPRPALALGTLGLFVSAMFDPLWFAARMHGLGLVPEPLWWLLGVVVSFYFGARHQVKSQEFQRDLAATLARAPAILDTIKDLREIRDTTPGAADPGPDAQVSLDAENTGDNPALDAWRRKRRG